MSGSGASRKRERRGKSPMREELPDFMRDPVGEHFEDEMSEGSESEEEIPRGPSRRVPAQAIFPELSLPLPRAPKLLGTRAKRPQLELNHHALSRSHYCTYRFISHEAHKDFLIDDGLTKKGAPEKFFPKSPKMSTALSNIFEREKLEEWFKIVEKECSSELTREILVNSRYWDRGESQDSRLIFCRGKFIVLTPETIGQALGYVRPDAPCAFHGFLSGEDCVVQVNRFYFQADHGPWEERSTLPEWKVRKGELKPRARWVCELLENWVLGVTQQPKYTFKLCALAYCVYAGIKIDIAWFIYESIIERRYRDCKKGPGHNFLFLAMAKKQGVSLTGVKMDIKRDPERKWSKIPGAIGDSLPPKGKGKSKASGSGTGSGATSDVATTLARMEGKMDRQFEYLRSNQRKLGALVETIGRWTIASAPNQGMDLYPPPPTSDPWYQSDGYEAQDPDHSDSE